MENTPLVSVYMPTHNRPAMAMRAIESVLAQSYKRLELIVCDDGSDEGVNAKLSIKLKDSGHTYIRNEVSIGACAARNTAISLCSGKYITGIDDDDEMHPERIETLLAAFDEQYAFLASGYFEVSASSTNPRRFDNGVISHDDLLHYNKVGNQIFTLTTRLKEVGLFDETLPAMQDYDMWIRLCKRYGPAKKLKECLYYLHTEHEEGRISTDVNKLFNAHEMIIRKHSGDYTRAHWKTCNLLRRKISGDALSPLELLKWGNSKNIKLALSYLLRNLR